VPRTHNDVEGFEAHTVSKRYTLKKYIHKTQESAIVFNTPAVLDCLGWKLGEFLALGKAIISTPLTRVMPATGKRDFYLETKEEDIGVQVRALMADKAARKRLEENAHQYYCDYLSPEKVIMNLIQHINEKAAYLCAE